MKKLTILLAMAMLSLSAMAQTNFRHITFAEAQKAARQEKKLIFVDFYTSWCGPCKHMANTVFPQKAVGDFMNDKFVCVKYDAEKEEADRVVANITKLLNEKSFTLTPLEFLNIHRHLFEGIFKHAGEIRPYDISKN